MTDPNTDLRALLAKYTVPPGPSCGIPKTDHAALIEALLAAGGTGSTIARIMWAEYKIKVAGQTIRRHARGDCTCPKR